MSVNYTRCPGCGKHCPVDSLSCEKGRRIIHSSESDSSDGYKMLYDSIDDIDKDDNVIDNEPSESHHGGCRGHRQHCSHGGRHGHGCHEKNIMHRFELNESASTEQQLLYKLHKCIHYLHHNTPGRAGQGRILMMLDKHGSITQRQLTDLAGVRSASLSEILSKLEHRGLIERSKNADDKRNIDVKLTDAGKNAVTSSQDARRKNEKELFSCLTEDEIEIFSKTLDKLINHWNKDN